MNPELAHEDYVYSSIFKGHQYEWMQKGDFRDVVTLTRTKVKDFYTKYYHPSNGQAFCFGPQDFVDECMNLMQPYLSQYKADDHIRKSSEVDWVELDKIKSMQEEVPYASYQDSNDFRLARTYVLNDQPMDDRTKMAWYIIEDLLVGNSQSVMPRFVADEGLGDDAFGGLQSHLRQWVLTLGVSGVPSRNKVSEARIRMQQRLFKIVDVGFDEDALKGTLNKLEMKFREQSSNGVPRGVQMFKDVLTTWNYDSDPRSPLSYGHAFAELKTYISENGQDLLLQLITKHLIDNEHNLATELYPSTNLLQVYKDVSMIETFISICPR
jgi:Zn-dependent M16 (insulinase) family peptidase